MGATDDYRVSWKIAVKTVVVIELVVSHSGRVIPARLCATSLLKSICLCKRFSICAVL